MKLFLSLCLFALGTSAAGAAPKKKTPVWTDPNDPAIPADFRFQGEYAGKGYGAQVIALGGGDFQAVLFEGGLPGAGWNGKDRSLMTGKLDGAMVTFVHAEGNRKYLGKSAAEFSATKPFPPQGHKPCAATLVKGVFQGSVPEDTGLKISSNPNGTSFTLTRTERTSPTLGARPPAGAKVLFDGTTKDAFQGGRLDEKTRLLNTDGGDIRTRDAFSDYTMHIEFMLAYRPDARGQGRGNSGFYQVDHYEVQILDSFGLEGEHNECGGVYKKAKPKVNMCFPPLAWQTYDIDFTNAKRDASGKKIANARLTLKHNGVVIHDNVEIDGPTGGHRKAPEGTPGPIKFQGHGNPTQFRNIWVVEK